MAHLVDSVQRVSAAIGEIHAGNVAQSSSMTSINQAVTELDQITQQNAAVVEESAAAAKNLQDQAGGLRDVAAQFRLPTMALALT
jgi:methyl-accepting chemotaxis protein